MLWSFRAPAAPGSDRHARAAIASIPTPDLLRVMHFAAAASRLASAGPAREPRIALPEPDQIPPDAPAHANEAEIWIDVGISCLPRPRRRDAVAYRDIVAASSCGPDEPASISCPLAARYEMSFAAVQKHVAVLEERDW
jgi:hypothetical protein